MKYSGPCPQWADKLLTSYNRELSPSDHLLLKEHLLTCPHCTTTHRTYLSIEAQLRNLAVLQPQRRFSAQLLAESEMQRKKIRRSDRIGRLEIILDTYAARLKNLAVVLLKPGYVLMVLLFCLLTTLAGIGVVNNASHKGVPQEAHSPQLIVDTTTILFNIINYNANFSSNQKYYKVPLVAQAIFTLQNRGGQVLAWRFDGTRNRIGPALRAVTISTQPFQGILKSNQRSQVLITARGISYEHITNGLDNFGYVLIASNGGDVSLHITLQKPWVTPQFSSVLPMPSYQNRIAV